MLQSRADYLVNKLISNELSGPELEEFLAGMGQSDTLTAYSDILETYFNNLMLQNEQANHPPLPENHPPP